MSNDHPTSTSWPIFRAWTWRMAWRDSRSSRRRLLLFSSSIMLGIAALVAIESFGHNLQLNVNNQTKALLGADLQITSRQPLTEAQEELLASFGGMQIEGKTFSSMLVMPKTDDTRLVQVVATATEFPFYGNIETDPPGAVEQFKKGEGMLLEPALITQYGVKIGDTVQLGQWSAPVLGSLTKIPGSGIGFASIAPRVYLPNLKAGETGLLQARSLVRYQRFFRFGPLIDVEKLMEIHGDRLREERLDYDTVERRKRNLGRAMTNLYNFLNLAGFIALLLGSVGIGSAIHVHVKQKLSTVAILRCLGSSSSQMFSVYLIQALALGVVGTLLGTAAGLALQGILPILLADFVPFEIEVVLSWTALFKAMIVGFAISLLFALMPLLSVRRVSPLAAIRTAFEATRKASRDPLLWLVYLAIAAGVTAFAISQTRKWEFGVGFAGALGVALLLLAGVARLITFLARRIIPRSLPYVWRQGLANLYRPNNRTLLLMLSIGLGMFLVLSLYLTNHVLVTQLFPTTNTARPNAILFEIYQDQKDEVVRVLDEMKIPVMQSAPIVNMRLSKVKGVETAELRNRKDSETKIPRWVLQRQYRSTYRDHLVDSEELLEGEWIETFDGDIGSVIPISLEQGIANDLGVTLGDQLTFDIDGIPIVTQVANLRKVDWRRIQPNFFVVFPPGILEDAPGFHIIATRVPSPEASAEMQRTIIKKFPNISAIDLTLVIQTVDDILDRVSFVIQFMALLTVATGLLVLAGAVMTGKYQRIQESVLLRTLGASRKQIQRILLSEYLFLGFFAGLTGALLAVAGSWGLATYVFKTDYSLAIVPLTIALGIEMLLVLVTGLLANRGVVNRPPLQILRSET